MSQTTTQMRSVVRGMHHVGLPSAKKDWDEIAAFWFTLGLHCRMHEVTQDDYDHAGAGPRLQVEMPGQLLLSYYDSRDLPFADSESWMGSDGLTVVQRYDAEHATRITCMAGQHVSLDVFPAALDFLRAHPAFERETHWGYGLVSVFLKGPYGLHVECTARDPDFHRDSEPEL